MVADELIVAPAAAKRERYRRISGDLGLERGPEGRAQDGWMLRGMAFMLATSLTFLFLGLDRETIDIGFDPGGDRNPGSIWNSAQGEARGHIRYNFRF